MALLRNVDEIRQALREPRLQFLELWVDGTSGSSMCALLNGARGWLMYLRQEEDAGFSSRAPNYKGPSDAVITYQLANGQTDEYPACWALDASEIARALEHFVATGNPPDWIHWHNDSGDGTTLGAGA